MRIRILQLKKTAFAALIVLLLSVVGMKNAFAQDQIATLLHDNDLSVYYGADAFIEAYTIAETGDIITLSGGTFNACNIDKAVTIHGAGYVYDNLMMAEPTKFEEYVSLSGGSETEHIIVEGIWFYKVYYSNLSFAEFNKCYFNYEISPSPSVSSPSANSLRFLNCCINGGFKCQGVTNVVFINSKVRSLNYFTSQTIEKNIIGYNSYVSFKRFSSGSNLTGYNSPKHCDLTNCIVSIADDDCVPSSSCTLNNCICITNGHGSLLQNAINNNCMEVETESEVFINGGNQILLDEIANSIVGTDGTQVGIHGGMCPWTDRPVYMIMRRCTVGSRTTDDGHLSVDIEVVTEQ